MTTLIFSDTHLTTKFEPKKFEKLKEVIEQADRVIINGDLFDGYLVDFEEFCRSKWQNLFPLLKQKRAIYILGNHDSRKKVNRKAKLFAQKVVGGYKFKSGGSTFLVKHGHELAPSIEVRLEFLSGLHQKSYFARTIYKFYEDFKEFAVSLVGPRYYNFTNRIETERLKHWAKKNLKENEYLIAGHTHFQTFDSKHRFIGAGMINYGFCQCVLIDRGEIKLINERY